MITEKERKDFELLVTPLIKWLNDGKKNPHMMIIVDPTSAKVVSGECGVTTWDYIKD